ncbi:unnamed protein product [Pleuronectes platessa]|uniref:Uncharacterized protein n=1 Tax=Pleuronectes platessa TaxID=8262 RepID=A0A9N7V3D0_PLEPL|nr:unnamed protein product [Pleuronectes platessa]
MRRTERSSLKLSALLGAAVSVPDCDASQRSTEKSYKRVTLPQLCMRAEEPLQLSLLVPGNRRSSNDASRRFFICLHSNKLTTGTGYFRPCSPLPTDTPRYVNESFTRTPNGRQSQASPLCSEFQSLYLRDLCGRILLYLAPCHATSGSVVARLL